MTRWNRFWRFVKIVAHAAAFAWRYRHAPQLAIHFEAYSIEEEPTLEDEWAQAQRESLHE